MIKYICFYSFLLLCLNFSSFAQNTEAVLIVSIDIVPPGDAAIFIDGERVYLSDGRIELTDGKHEILIEKDGFERISEKIKVSRKKACFQFQLTANPYQVYGHQFETSTEKQRNAYLKIVTSQDAEVYLDEVKIDANKFIEYEIGLHQLVVFELHSDTIVESFSLKEGDTLELSLFPQNKINIKEIPIDMIKVDGGRFLMGNPGNKSNAKLHEVEVDGFFIAKYEVSQFLWKAVMKTNPSSHIGDSLPVENVSWDELQIFLNRLNKLTGKKYRLPTEAEWEFAARGGKKNKNDFQFAGSSIIDSVAWYWRNSGDSILVGRWDNELMKTNHCRIRKVGQLLPNALGIYDMSGNVWEWCVDWYEEEYYIVSPPKNPLGPEKGKTKVCRGGSYISKASYCKNGARFSYLPGSAFNYLGFRLALDIE